MSIEAIENGIFALLSLLLLNALLQKLVHYSASLAAFAVQRKHAGNGPISFDCIYVVLRLNCIVIIICITIAIVLRVRIMRVMIVQCSTIYNLCLKNSLLEVNTEERDVNSFMPVIQETARFVPLSAFKHDTFFIAT